VNKKLNFYIIKIKKEHMKKLVFLIALICITTNVIAQKKQVKERAGKSSEDKLIPTEYAFPKE
jgi:hypothetical protein